MEWELVPDPDNPDDWYCDECWDRWESEQQVESAARVSNALAYLIATIEEDPDESKKPGRYTQHPGLGSAVSLSMAPHPEASQGESSARDDIEIKTATVTAPQLDATPLSLKGKYHSSVKTDSIVVSVSQTQPSPSVSDGHETDTISPLVVPLVETTQIEKVQIQAASTINDEVRRAQIERDRLERQAKIERESREAEKLRRRPSLQNEQVVDSSGNFVLSKPLRKTAFSSAAAAVSAAVKFKGLLKK